MENDNSTSQDDGKNSNISSDLIRGHINTIILRTLCERDKYGYEIIEEIESKSHGQYTLKQPTLYSALKRLESQGYINAYWKTDETSGGGRRKYYTISDSGREISEKNQSEWEYSRTVIDSLISDRSFDFTQPPPSAVDFKILKSSTTRVPVIKDDDEDNPEIRREVAFEETPEVLREVKFEEPAATDIVEEPANAPEPAQPIVVESVTVVEEPKQVEQKSVEQPPSMDEEQRRILHENYMKLINSETNNATDTSVVPDSEHINTDKLIYINKPEPERDYKNLLNNLYAKTYSAKPVQEHVPTREPAPAKFSPTVRYEDTAKSEVVATEYVSSGSRRKKFNRGSTLLVCSLIIAAIMFVEFALCLALKNDLGIDLGYPFVILVLAAVQVAICLALKYSSVGKSTRKPASLTYMTASIILSVIIIAIILVVSFILEVNFASAGDIAAKIIFPCLITLNIPLFALLYYLFSR
ncbi:MAG: PadR family transcriptional regulator [Clostridiales bacterium]|nr:PadR family transcriptional regulator [Clostridiales bacterium]